MAIAASIYMYPPSILVSDVPSGCNFAPVNSKGAFGLIEQVNRNTLALSVGNVIFYNDENAAAINYNNGTVYKVVDENKVCFIEVRVIPS